MIKIEIKGLNEGKYEESIQVPYNNGVEAFDEFFGNIEINYALYKHGNRYNLNMNFNCKAKLVCDISGEDFETLIKTNLDMSYVADTERYLLNKDKEFESDQNYIPEDSDYIDITREVLEQLAVSLPMKRVSPKYEDIEFADLFPEIAEKEKQNITDDNEDLIDERWSKLKNLKLN